MDIQALEQIGLTKTEIKIYLALLKLGQSTTTNIIKESGIHASKVYQFLDKLASKGLVSHVIKANKKYFSASKPESLKEYINEKKKLLDEQEKSINELIPTLKAIEKEGNESIKAEIYEGIKGIRAIEEKALASLNKGETQYIIGAPKEGNEAIEGFLLDWHKRRLKKGVKCKYVYNSNAREYGKVRENMPLTEVRYFDERTAPMWIEIFKDYVVIAHIKNFNSLLFLIKDKQIAEGYLDYFNFVWKNSNK